MNPIVIASIVSGGLQMIGGYLSQDEEPDYTALTETVGMSLMDLQETFDFLTRPGGTFEQKGELIDYSQDVEIGANRTAYETKVETGVSKAKQLEVSTGFKKSGIAKKAGTKVVEDIYSDYSTTVGALGAKHDMEDYEFRMQKYETLQSIEREMRTILADYAGTTGASYDISDFESMLEDYQSGLETSSGYMMESYG